MRRLRSCIRSALLCGKPTFSALGLNWRCAGRRTLGSFQLLNFKHPGQGQLKTGWLGKSVWPQLSQIDPFERGHGTEFTVDNAIGTTFLGLGHRSVESNWPAV